MRNLISALLISCFFVLPGFARPRLLPPQIVVSSEKKADILPVLRESMVGRGYRLARESESFAEYEEVTEKCLIGFCMPVKIVDFSLVQQGEAVQVLGRMYLSSDPRPAHYAKYGYGKEFLNSIFSEIKAKLEAIPVPASQPAPSAAQ